MLSKFPDFNIIQRKPFTKLITRFLNSLIADISCLKRNRRIVNLVTLRSYLISWKIRLLKKNIQQEEDLHLHFR